MFDELNEWVEMKNNEKIDMNEVRKLIMPQNTEWLKTQESGDVFTNIFALDIPYEEMNKMWQVELDKHGVVPSALSKLDIVEDKLYD